MPSITRRVCAQVICSSSQNVRRPTKATNGNDQPNSAEYWWQLSRLLSILICVASVIFSVVTLYHSWLQHLMSIWHKTQVYPTGLPSQGKIKTKMANHPHCSSTAIYSLFTANSYVQYNWSTEHKMLPKIIPLYHEWRQGPSAVSAWIVLNHHDLVNNPESATHFPSLHTWPEISDQKRQKITNFRLSLECETRMLQHRAL